MGANVVLVNQAWQVMTDMTVFYDLVFDSGYGFLT